jgi:hypothetical protein
MLVLRRRVKFAHAGAPGHVRVRDRDRADEELRVLVPRTVDHLARVPAPERDLQPLRARQREGLRGLRHARVVRRVSVERSLIGDTVGAVGAASLVLHGNYAPGWRMLTEASG